jgi:hypothetical protein
MRPVAIILVLALVTGCGTSVAPTPSERVVVTPQTTLTSQLPTPRPIASLPPAKCAGSDDTSFGVVGWRGSRVELERARFIGCDAQSFSYWSVDPKLGDWRIDIAPGVADTSASDGRSVAMSFSGRLIVIEADGTTKLVTEPPGPPLLGGLAALVGGGYVFTGVPRLDRLMPGTYEPKRVAVPTGFAVAAPTSDPTQFILALASEADRLPWGLTKEPYHAYLWAVGSTRPTLIAKSAFARPAGIGLAYLTLASGDRLLGRDGILRPVDLPGVSWLRSSDDSAYLDVSDPNAESVQSIALRSLSTGRVLATVQASIGTPQWEGDQVAFVPRGVREPSALIVLGPGMSLVEPLP